MFSFMRLIYQLITLFVLVIVVWNTIEAETKTEKAVGAMMVAPLLLRVLLIK